MTETVVPATTLKPRVEDPGKENLAIELERRDASANADDPSALAATRADAKTRATGNSRQPLSRTHRFIVRICKTLSTLAIVAVAAVGALLTWDYYVTAPWTRNGSIRVQVASIAPQVSGQIIDVRVADNQFVRRGDILYVIDPFDFRISLEAAKATLRMRAADLQVKQQQANRRQNLTNLSTTVEDTQIYAGNAAQAKAMFDEAQVQLAQAEINLKRTEVRSTVNGYVTNLLMRVGDYARAGTTNISVIDTDSYWIDGYFEETKMAHVCVGDRATAKLMGYPIPISGVVETITRGISVSNATPSTQGLPSVDPIYTWVRLAQRVPVRIRITDVPVGIPLVSGMTATVGIVQDGSSREEGDWFEGRYERLKKRLHALIERPESRADCVPGPGNDGSDIQAIPAPKEPAKVPAERLNPGLAPGMTEKPTQPGN
jgi:multidrug resistance efflux pump